MCTSFVNMWSDCVVALEASLSISLSNLYIYIYIPSSYLVFGIPILIAHYCMQSPDNQLCNLNITLSCLIWWLSIYSLYCYMYCWKTCVQLRMPLSKINPPLNYSAEYRTTIQPLPWWSTVCILYAYIYIIYMIMCLYRVSVNKSQ